MRKVIYGGACSFDGFLTDRSGAIDWLHFSNDVRQLTARSWESADTILIGRKTYDVAAAQGGGGGSMPGISTYLFSRTMTQAPTGAELVSSGAGAFVRALKAKPGKDIIVMSGGNLATSLLKEGVIDEIGMNVHPILLGGGTPAFLDPGVRVSLELTECLQLDGGCVFVNYRVRR